MKLEYVLKAYDGDYRREVEISVFAKTEKESIERAKEIITRERYVIIEAHEIKEDK